MSCHGYPPEPPIRFRIPLFGFGILYLEHQFQRETAYGSLGTVNDTINPTFVIDGLALGGLHILSPRCLYCGRDCSRLGDCNPYMRIGQDTIRFIFLHRVINKSYHLLLLLLAVRFCHNELSLVHPSIYCDVGVPSLVMQATTSHIIIILTIGTGWGLLDHHGCVIRHF